MVISNDGIRRRAGEKGVGYTSKFQAFIWGMSRKEREQYAHRAGTTLAYLETHLSSRRKIPGKILMASLAKAAQGKVSLEEILAHFYAPQES